MQRKIFIFGTMLPYTGLLYVDCMRYVYSGTICRLSVGCVWHVDRVSPAGCTLIRIAVTLEYEYRLFIAVIT
jgi:hypothetical protein